MSSHWHSNHTQVYWACDVLTKGYTINHMDEIGEVKGWRLSAIVHNLRRKHHWPIEIEYRGPERIAHYRLAKCTDWRALSFPQSALGVRQALKAASSTVQTSSPDIGGKPQNG